MVIALLIISILILAACFLVYYFRKKPMKKLNWLILILPAVFSLVVIFLSFSIQAPLDVRYVEYPAEAVRYYPEWQEEITSNDTTENYSVNHYAYYTMMYRGDGNKRELEKEIPASTYKYFTEIWENHEKEDSLLNTRGFIRCKWDQDMYTALVHTKTQPYINYFQNIMNLYNFENVSDNEAKELGLFKRKGVTMMRNGVLEPRQGLIYGLSVPDSISRASSFVSTVDHSFRPILLVWERRSNRTEIISKQRSYWDGGKDNEVVFCISLNNFTQKKILWSGSFSWAENKDFEDYILISSLHPGNTLEMDKYINSLLEGYQNGLWKPRDFQNYSLAQIPFDTLMLSFFSLIVIALNITLIYKLIKRIPELNDAKK